jgi:hypothetical protein
MATALWDAHPVFSLANGVDDSTSPTNPARNILEQRYKYIAIDGASQSKAQKTLQQNKEDNKRSMTVLSHNRSLQVS